MEVLEGRSAEEAIHVTEISRRRTRNGVTWVGGQPEEEHVQGARCTVMHRSCRVSKCRELVHHGVRKAEGGLTASSGAGRTESSCANTKHCVFRQVIIL